MNVPALLIGARLACRFLRHKVFLPACVLMAGATSAHALTFASWNLGWHLSRAEALGWIQACSTPYVLSADQSRYEPAGGSPHDGAAKNAPRPAWSLDFGRSAKVPVAWPIEKVPPCNVYQAGRGPDRNVVVTAAAWDKRLAQIAQVLARLDADVIAFQEVSGEQAIRDALGPAARDYDVCSFTDHKVQRLGFAWRRASVQLAEPCRVVEALSLPQAQPEDRPRPGLEATLLVAGQRWRVLNVHLKSGCVSPLEDRPARGEKGGRGDLAGEAAPCRVLQQQVPALEQWLESRAAGVEAVLIIGDFNRNLAHEAAEQGRPVRTGTSASPASPFPPQARVRNLLKEINDGEPAATSLVLLPTDCPVSPRAQVLCEAAHSRLLDRSDEMRELTDARQLGCRNAIGLDHVLVSRSIAAKARRVEKVPLGLFGRTSAARPDQRDAILAVSDHCPLRVVFAP